MKKPKTINGFSLRFMPFAEIEALSSGDRIKKILDVALENRIVIVQGRLKPEEESRLIEDTMVMIGRVKGFKGIELSVLQPNANNLSIVSRVKHNIANALVSSHDALTIIGPASIVREIRKDPKKVEIFMKR